AQAAIDAASEDWSSPSGRRVDFHPDPKRYRQSYVAWLAEKRDWCISRQLWWGHQIPVWWRKFDKASALAEVAAKLPKLSADEREAMHVWVGDDDGNQYDLADNLAEQIAKDAGPFELQVCLRSEAADAQYGSALEALGLERDADVLDTWFSSALWPFSTLGWPDAAHAPIEPGQRFLGAQGEQPSSLETYYP
ncbi:MAG: class I tRNA ligase family protein, partial [Calditrichaeota bacterium]|nr:class I tRNA ligase family protein [Calditrichota bacterium]